MKKKAFALILKFTISIGLIWYLFQNIDLMSVWDRMLRANALDLAIAGLILSVQIIISISRWRAVMVAINTVLPYWLCLRIFLIGLFFNQVLPSSVGGDAVRIYKSFKAGLTIREAIHGIMLERVATVLGLLVLATAASPFFQSQVTSSEANWMVSFASVLLGVGIVGTIFLMFLDRLPRKFRSWRIVIAMSEFAADTRRTFLSPTHASKALGWSILGHFAITVSVYFIAKSLALNVTILDCMVLIPPVMLITTLPISIAGWGVREGAMVTAFALIGVQAGDALALSFLFGLMSVILAIPGGITWLLTSDKEIEEIPPEQQV